MSGSVLVLERVLAHAVICGLRKFANLWLLPKPELVGQRIGIHAELVEPDEAGWWYWFYTARQGMKLPKLAGMSAGVIGSVKLERVAQPGELGHTAFGPAVWVFSEPLQDAPKGRLLRAGYGDQPHVRERDKLKAGHKPRKESEAK